jgi:hypothetical protein
MMRKKVINPVSRPTNEIPTETWLPLADVADIEVTSESAAHPIEAALESGQLSGWRAATPGVQTIRLLFRQKTPLRRIVLRFVEHDVERTQEYVLRWSPDGQSFHEVVRQQWNFSPHGSTEEIEDHQVELPAATALELTIIPDKNSKHAVASLAKFGVA